MSGDNVEFTLKANTSEAADAVASFAKNANHALGILELDAFLEIGEKIKEVFVEIGHEVIETLKECVEKASEAESALTSMNVALKLSGNYSAEASDHFEALAEHIQATTSFSKEQAFQALSMAQSFNISNTMAEKLTVAAEDLAAATGESLVSATQQLGRTLDGNLGRFGKMVPQLKSLTTTQLEHGAAIDIVAQRYSGFAAAIGDTFQGNLEKIKHAFNEVYESVGKIIIQNPVVQELMKQLLGVLTGISSYVDSHSNIVGRFLSEGIIGSVKMIDGAVQKTQTTVSVTGFLIAGVERAVYYLAYAANAGIESIIWAITKLVEGMVAAVEKLFEFFKMISQTSLATAIFEKLGISTKDVGEGLQYGIDQLKAFEEVVDNNKILSYFQSLQEGLKEAINSAGSNFKDFGNILGKVDLAAQKLAASLEKVKTKGQKGKSDAAGVDNKNVDLSDIGGKERGNLFSTLVNDPFGAFNDLVTKPKNATSKDLGVGVGLGVSSDVLQGSAGAGKLIDSLGALGADTILPGLGKVVGPLLDAFQKGPDAVRGMVQEFAKALPQLVQAIIKSAPVFALELIKQIPNIIQGFVDGVPDVVQALVDDIPSIIEALINDLPHIVGALVSMMPQIQVKLIQLMPGVVAKFAEEFLKIPEQFLQKLLDGLKPALQNPLQGLSGGGVGGGVLGSVFGPIGTVAGALGIGGGGGGGGLGVNIGGFSFAKGGEVPAGYPNDSAKANVSSGETVIDETTTGKLKDFLNEERAQKFDITFQVGPEKLAKVLLMIDKNGLRTKWA